MAVFASSSALRQLRFVVASWKEDARTDVELLLRFIQSRDEQAFTTLVGRHGEMVLRVCFRVLRNSEDAEDALQATFLRLARDAGRIVKREALAGWLFHVAESVRSRCDDQSRGSVASRSASRRWSRGAKPRSRQPIRSCCWKTKSPRCRPPTAMCWCSSALRAGPIRMQRWSSAAQPQRCTAASSAQTRIRRRLARHGPVPAILLATAKLSPWPAVAAAPALLAQEC